MSDILVVTKFRYVTERLIYHHHTVYRTIRPKICDDGTLVQILCFEHYSSSCLYLKKHRPVYFSKHNVSEIGPNRRFYVKTETESSLRRLGPIK
jgi:hypothetical protein